MTSTTSRRTGSNVTEERCRVAATMTAGDLVGGTGRPRGLSASRTVVFAAAHLLLVVLGRATVPDGASASLFWPAAGVVVLWLMAETPRRWPLVLALVGAELVLGLGLTGADATFVVLAVLSVWVQSVAIVAGLRRWTPWLLGAGGHEGVRTPRAISRVLVVVAAACLLGALVGATGVWLGEPAFDAMAYVAWWARQYAAVVIVGGVGHLAWEWFTERPRPRAYGGGPRELALLAVGSGVTAVAVFLQPLPLAYLLLPFSVWCAARYATFFAGLQVAGVGIVAVVLTLGGHGPYGDHGDSPTGALLIQVFILVMALTALGVGILSDRIDDLVAELETSLRQSAARGDLLRGVTESMGEGLVVLDPDGRVALSNAASRRLARRFTPGADDQEALTSLVAALDPMEAAGRARRVELGPGDVLVDLPGGEEVVLAVTSGPVGGPEDGHEPGRLLVLREVTEHRAGLRPLVDFASTVAHDLRGPLTVMHTWLSLLDESPAVAADEHLQTSVERINRGAVQMGRLIDDLLAHAVAEGGVLSPEVVALGGRDGVVAEVVGLLAAPEGTVRVVGPLPSVRADRGAVRQVLANLVDNARKYARPEVPPEIEVSAAREGDRVVVSVRDNGIGVPAEDRDRVFDRFQRAGATRSASRGSGIGLSICRTIVERHGGTIACLPVEDGPGSVFRFDLPAAGS